MRDDLVLYHVTHKDNIASIFQEGLLINPPKNNWDGTYLEDKLYFAFDAEVAMDYATTSDRAEEEGWDEKDFVILIVPFSLLDQDAFLYDWNNLCEYSREINSVAYKKDVPLSILEHVQIVPGECAGALKGFELEDYKDSWMYEIVMNTFDEEVESNKERED